MMCLLHERLMRVEDGRIARPASLLRQSSIKPPSGRRQSAVKSAARPEFVQIESASPFDNVREGCFFALMLSLPAAPRAQRGESKDERRERGPDGSKTRSLGVIYLQGALEE